MCMEQIREKEKSPAVVIIFSSAEISPKVIQSSPEHMHLRIRAKAHRRIGIRDRRKEPKQGRRHSPQSAPPRWPWLPPIGPCGMPARGRNGKEYPEGLKAQ